MEQKEVETSKAPTKRKQKKWNSMELEWKSLVESQTDTAQNGQKSMLNIINLIRRSAKYLPDYIAF